MSETCDAVMLSMETLPKDKTRGCLVMFSSALTIPQHPIFDLTGSLQLSPHSDIVTRVKSAVYQLLKIRRVDAHNHQDQTVTWNSLQIYKAGSPLSYSSDLKVPILLLG